MNKLNLYLQLIDPKSIVLPLSSIFVAVTLPFVDFVDYTIDFPFVVLLMAAVTAIQILSNVAGVLGRFRHTADREGYVCADKDFPLGESVYKTCFITAFVLSSAFVLWAVYYAYGTFFSLDAFVFMLGGVLVLRSAAGRASGSDFSNTGYYRDFHLFLFYGIVAVTGAYLMCVKTIPNWLVLLPASAMGFFSVSVNNLRNLNTVGRDRMECRTIPVLWGKGLARLYQLALLLAAWLCMLVYSALHMYNMNVWFYLFSLPLFVLDLLLLFRVRGDGGCETNVAVLLISITLFSALAGVGLSQI